MPILSILVVLLIVGVVLYLIEQVPMDATMRTIIRVVVILIVVVWLLSLIVPGLGIHSPVLR